MNEEEANCRQAIIVPNYTLCADPCHAAEEADRQVRALLAVAT